MPEPDRPPRAFYFLLALVVFLFDQASKWLVVEALTHGESRRLLPGLLNLAHVRNRGAAFGLFAEVDSPAVLVGLVGFSLAALVLVLGLLWRGPGSPLAGWGLGLILGGALGNLVDRLRDGTVVDFLDLHLGPYHWPAFNLADSAIVVGATVLVIEVWRSHRRVASEA